MRKPEVGEKLWLVDINRRDHNQQRGCIVSKVGRKYFTVKEKIDSYFEIQFHIEDWTEKTDYTRSYCLYENRQTWKYEQEVIKYTEEFRRTFDVFRHRKDFSLDQLRNAAGILNIKIK